MIIAILLTIVSVFMILWIYRPQGTFIISTILMGLLISFPLAYNNNYWPLSQAFYIALSIHIIFMIGLLFVKNIIHYIKFNSIIEIKKQSIILGKIVFMLILFIIFYYAHHRTVYVKKNTPKPKHHLQQKLKYVEYVESYILQGTDNMQVVDMAMPLGPRSISVLDDNKTIHMNITNKNKYIKIYIEELKKVQLFKISSWDKKVFASEDSNVKENFVVYVKNKYSETETMYYQNIFATSTDKYIKKKMKSMGDKHTATNDTKTISGLRNDIAYILVDKNKKQLQSYRIRKFKITQLKYTPKLVMYASHRMYRGQVDTIFLTYEGKKGLYVFNDKYEGIQEIVRNVINNAVVPHWITRKNDNLNAMMVPNWNKKIDDNLTVSVEQFDRLQKLLMKNPSVDYRYNVMTNDNKATIIITSLERKDLKLIFELSKNKKWKIDNILFQNKNMD